MNTFTQLDPLSTSLTGINLIEASAGTGKTYTITTLLLRLLIETDLRIDQILIVTFTEAATAELRTRIRKRLQEALQAFKNGQTPDEGLQQLLTYYPEKESVCRRLDVAIRGFENAKIFTIHGFCWRVLRNNAFESGLPFDFELIKDQTALLTAITEDFWRQHFYHAPPLFIEYANQNKCGTPSELLQSVKQGRYIDQPFLRVIPTLVDLSSTSELAQETLQQQYAQAFIRAQQHWQTAGSEVATVLTASIPHLNKTVYKAVELPSWCRALDYLFATATPSLSLPEKFDNFTARKIKEKTLKNKPSPSHPFFETVEQLLGQQQQVSEHFNKHLLSLKVQFLNWAAKELRQRKQQQRLQSFDDLLVNLYRVLDDKRRGTHLIREVHREYKAALIDEFQDTDRVQYHIFARLFGQPDKRNPSIPPRLFFIGDPKQAIYSFRGADIYTYLQACDAATGRYTLPINWRSEGQLVTAINALFNATPHPFLFEKIAFHSVKPAPRQVPRLTLLGQDTPPLHLWFFPRTIAGVEPHKPINKEWAHHSIPRTVSAAIHRLIHLGCRGQAHIDGRAVTAGDIAILVRNHKQAQLIQKQLTYWQIPSVLYSRQSLFAADEVKAIERILLAIATPNHEGLVKAALTTPLLGVDGNTLYQLQTNDWQWAQRLGDFQRYHNQWRTQGFMPMFRQLMVEERVAPRLLRYTDGQRRLTNVLHAIEVLQQTVIQEKLGMTGLCHWLAQQRYRVLHLTESDEPDEQQLRLESDERRVKIVTIHSSKGLEYPIVFCPFLWDGHLHHKETVFTFHENEQQLVLDLGSSEQESHKQQALREERAENLRLLYVAVTRAKQHCTIICGAFNDFATSALGYILYPHLSEEQLKEAEDEVLQAGLNDLVARSDHTVEVRRITKDMLCSHAEVSKQTTDNQEDHTPPLPLQARVFQGTINRQWRISSFTALSATHHNRRVEDTPDHDESTQLSTLAVTEKIKEPAADSIFRFPKGAKAGIFLHALFEHLDFTQVDNTYCIKQLRRYGYDVEQWQTTIIQFVHEVLETPLQSGQPEFTLSRISREQRLNELEFYYPLGHMTLEGLETLFTAFDLPAPLLKRQPERLTFSPIQGFMKGYIDMIFEYGGKFYLVDYKSNFLGTQPAAYHHTQLNAVMTQEDYVLQYHIYCIALHRYLQTRLANYCYAQHFGGVYYLFLRGMSRAQGAEYGIFRDVPNAMLIERLSQYVNGDL